MFSARRLKLHYSCSIFKKNLIDFQEKCFFNKIFENLSIRLNLLPIFLQDFAIYEIPFKLTAFDKNYWHLNIGTTNQQQQNRLKSLMKPHSFTKA